jgi:proton-translocating NADH-quinone oxidoreductase, chain L
MNYEIPMLLILFLPLISFVFLSLAGRRISPAVAGLTGITVLSVVTALSFFVAYNYFFVNGAVNGEYQKLAVFNEVWLKFSDVLSINLGVMLDPISVMMLIVISFISCMVHLYSWNYMHGEDRFQMYYAYLSLFTFSMLGLVVAVNIFQMYIFWELVGVSSFLLIGFYYTKPSAIAAAKKAFIVTRFADLGFLLGILLVSHGAGTLDFATMIERLSNPHSPFAQSMMAGSFLGMSTLSWGLILIFIGGAGKSAMFPLHIWLPDAMEGPTPVSALIHAATMVVAGVFLVARLFPIFAQSAPDALHIVGYVGAITALFAAIIACTQTDIKRVLAYSTVSQIAFMMFSLGVSGWGEEASEGFTGSLFHLFTHAFFKAMLFMGAGAVIHAVHSNEMEDMGGLRKKMPITHLSFLVACLAIAGVPGFAGFFSKEVILSAAFNGDKLIYVIGLLTSGITAFYMFRLYFRIFWFKEAAHGHGEHGHDSHESHTPAMNTALILLIIATLVVGYIPFGHFVSADGKALELPFHLALAIPPVAIGLLGIFIAYVLFAKENDKPTKITNALGGFYKAAYNKFYIDEIYLFVTKKVLFNLIGRPAAWVDRNVVDNIYNGSASITTTTSEAIKKFQSGRVQSYATYFLIGVIFVALLFLFAN